MVGLTLSCIVSQDNEEVASGVADAGDAERASGEEKKYETENGGRGSPWNAAPDISCTRARPCPVTPTHINLFRQESRSRQDKWPAKRL